MSRPHTNILDVSVWTDTRYDWCQYRKKYCRITRRKPATSRSGFCRYNVDKVDYVDSLWKMQSIMNNDVIAKKDKLSTKKHSPTTTILLNK